jgi:hypothetical protein
VSGFLDELDLEAGMPVAGTLGWVVDPPLDDSQLVRQSDLEQPLKQNKKEKTRYECHIINSLLVHPLTLSPPTPTSTSIYCTVQNPYHARNASHIDTLPTPIHTRSNQTPKKCSIVYLTLSHLIIIYTTIHPSN